MGTRADFYYIDDDGIMTWLGSIAWDGHPESIPTNIITANIKSDFIKSVNIFLKSRDDGTLPHMGWPWPWPDSGTTDYSYIFDKDRVYCCHYGKNLMEAIIWTEIDEYPEGDGKLQKFPDMSSIEDCVLHGPRSGLLF